MSANYSDQLGAHEPPSVPNFDTVDGEGFGGGGCLAGCSGGGGAVGLLVLSGLFFLEGWIFVVLVFYLVGLVWFCWGFFKITCKILL